LPASSSTGIAPAPPAEREGCERTGQIELAEKDPECILDHPPRDPVRDLSRALRMTLVAEPSEIHPAGTVLLRLAVTNVARSEVLVPFEIASVGGIARPDWSRFVGGPEIRGDPAAAMRLAFPVVTLDAHERPIDGLPMLAPRASPAPSRIIAVRLAPGAAMTHAVSWWAMRIPTPAPKYHNDAGHLIVPKTYPVPLAPGDYIARLEVPVLGLAPAERSASANVRVADMRDVRDK
jgi:hypothetical protein